VAIGQVGFGFGSDRSGQFDLLEQIGSDWVGSGSGQFTCYIFFRSLINFDWIEGHLISGQVRSGLDRVGSV
jgi:hypothetical protein